jgi:voltage-gated potassium channel
MSKMFIGVSVLAGVCVAGIIGYAIAGWSVADGAYMVVISIFGVGYGEVRPVHAWELRVLTGFVIIAGYGAVIYTVGGFIQLVVDGELKGAFGARRMMKEIDKLENHTIICGFGRMGQSLARELDLAGRRFVAIDPDPQVSAYAEEHGWMLLAGDATEEELLERAGIARASALAAVLSDDATNVFVTLTARAMNATMLIVARGENRQTESKLLRCGASRVVMPTDIGATKMSHLIVRPTAEEMLERMGTAGDVDLAHLGLEFDEITVTPGSPWVNRSLGEVEVRGAHGYLIVGVRGSDGTTSTQPPSDLVLGVGDTVLVLGFHDDIPQIGPKQPPSAVTGRG